ncbi:VOC family protein [Levilactobacillus bambusae]|uniref:Glyoxalase/bleomycin resistance/extradiol dioxygenase family protein n=1 Tax=Levilactobacillus bambusae TaxID=2024736 RepID=A0A2V1MZ70_9LACO|nr:VOC family protein [Levilactobacillus bambusae]PWG00269.1 glyoxalase/bleomycin resistance/extradiol dioxygenase family protein [Levilactobacillus bambusae]
MAIKDDITGIQHVGIPTDDLDRTIRFYEALGFVQAGLFKNGANRCAFLRLGTLTIETWEGDPVTKKTGAINHFSLDTTNIEAAFRDAQTMGLTLKESEIQSIPTFWDHGIRYFNILGPNGETIEFCQIL